jgi:hypothetical protein
MNSSEQQTDFEVTYRDHNVALFSDQGVFPGLVMNTMDPHYHACVRNFIQLQERDVARTLAGKHVVSEGTFEMELYVWLYSPLVLGCSRVIDRAWYS